MQTEERRRLVRMLADNSPLSQSVTEAWWLMPAQTMLERVQDCRPHGAVHIRHRGIWRPEPRRGRTGGQARQGNDAAARRHT